MFQTGTNNFEAFRVMQPVFCVVLKLAKVHLFKYHTEELTKDLRRPTLTIAMSKVEAINDVPKKVYYVF